MINTSQETRGPEITSENWRNFSNCNGLDMPEVFGPVAQYDISAAAVCWGCAVRKTFCPVAPTDVLLHEMAETAVSLQSE